MFALLFLSVHPSSYSLTENIFVTYTHSLTDCCRIPYCH